MIFYSPLLFLTALAFARASVASTSTAESDFRYALNNNIHGRCVFQDHFMGGYSVIGSPRAVRSFNSFKNEKLIGNVELMIKNREASNANIRATIKAYVPAIVIGGIGLLLLIVGIVFSCCVLRCARKCWARCTCGRCCRDRRRFPFTMTIPENRCLLGCWVISFGIIGMVIGILLISTSLRFFGAGYATTTCDVNMSVKGFFDGGAAVRLDPATPPGAFTGLHTFTNTTANIEHIVDRSTKVLLNEALDAVNKTNTTLHGAVDTIANETSAASTYVRTAEALLSAIDVNHTFTMATIDDGHIYGGIPAEVKNLTVETMDSVKQVVETNVGAHSDNLADIYGNLETVAKHAGNAADDLRAVYMEHVDKQTRTADIYYYWFRLAGSLFVFITFVVIFATGLVYCCLGFQAPEAVVRSSLIQTKLGCNYVCLFLFGAINLILAGFVYAILTSSSSACEFTQNRLIRSGDLSIFGVHNTTLQNVANECIADSGSGDLMAVLGFEGAMENALNKTVSLGTDLSKGATAKFPFNTTLAEVAAVRRGIISASWIVLPSATSYNPNAVFPDYGLTSHQLFDHVVNCADLPSGARPAVCSTGSTSFTVSGLRSLNARMNTSPVTPKFCMNRLRGDHSITGCNAKSRKIITSTTDPDTDIDIQSEYKTLSGTFALQWLNAIRLAVQKEKLYDAGDVFPCNGESKSCNLSAFAPYVDQYNSTLSTFTRSLISTADQVAESVSTMQEAGTALGDTLAALVETNITTALSKLMYGMNCSYVGFAVRRVAKDACQIWFPMWVSTLNGLCILAICSILTSFASWRVYHYIVDLRRRAPFDVEEVVEERPITVVTAHSDEATAARTDSIHGRHPPVTEEIPLPPDGSRFDRDLEASVHRWA